MIYQVSLLLIEFIDIIVASNLLSTLDSNQRYKKVSFAQMIHLQEVIQKMTM